MVHHMDITLALGWVRERGGDLNGVGDGIEEKLEGWDESSFEVGKRNVRNF